MLVKNEGLSSKISNYLKLMIDDFSEGNDNYYGEGTLVSFVFEEDEKGDLDLYEKEDVENFYEVREFIKNKGGELIYISKFADEDLEYTFKVIENYIECSFIEPYWEL